MWELKTHILHLPRVLTVHRPTTMPSYDSLPYVRYVPTSTLRRPSPPHSDYSSSCSHESNYPHHPPPEPSPDHRHALTPWTCGGRGMDGSRRLFPTADHLSQADPGLNRRLWGVIRDTGFFRSGTKPLEVPEMWQKKEAWVHILAFANRS